VAPGGAKRLIGIVVGSRAMFEDLTRFVTAAHIRPAIDRVFEFGQAREAVAYLSSAGHFGKVVIDVGQATA
jgi:NADPH:quinone reductase-like Zn-dependent oxidoreductase